MSESLRQIQTLRERPLDDDDVEFQKYRISDDDFEVAKETHADETDKFLEFVERMHIEPTERQKNILTSIDHGLESVCEKYDIKKTRLSRPAMFFIKREDFKDILMDEGVEIKRRDGNPDTGGFYIPERDAILVWYRTTVWGGDRKNQKFLDTTAHERWHAESRRVLAARKDENNKPKIVSHQSGLHIERLRKPNTSLFWDFNEAVTESLSLELAADVINNREREQFKDLIREQIEDHLLQYIRKNPNEVQRHALSAGFAQEHMSGFRAPLPGMYDSTPMRQKILQEWHEKRTQYVETHFPGFVRALLENYQFDPDTGVYQKQRKMFEKLLVALAARSPEFEHSIENARRRFYQAYIEGEFWKLGRIIDSSLGRGTFKLLAEEPMGTFRGFMNEELARRLRLPRGSKSMLKSAV